MTSDGRRTAQRDGARDLADLDAVVSALAHASRRHVLVVLKARGGTMAAGDVADRFACSWPTTSRHVKVLLDAGLIAVRREGRRRVYLLVPRRLDVLLEWLDYLRRRPAGRARPSARGPGSMA